MIIAVLVLAARRPSTAPTSSTPTRSACWRARSSSSPCRCRCCAASASTSSGQVRPARPARRARPPADAAGDDRPRRHQLRPAHQLDPRLARLRPGAARDRRARSASTCCRRASSRVALATVLFPTLSAASPPAHDLDGLRATMRQRRAPDRAAADPGGRGLHRACSRRRSRGSSTSTARSARTSTELSRGAVLVLVQPAVRGREPAAHAHVLLAPAALAADGARGARTRRQPRRVASRSTGRSASPGSSSAPPPASVGDDARRRPTACAAMLRRASRAGRRSSRVGAMLAAAALLGAVAYGVWAVLDAALGPLAGRPGRLASARAAGGHGGLRAVRAALCAIPEARQLARLLVRGGCGARRALGCTAAHGRPGPHPQLLDHRPHRPWEVDAGRPHPRAHAHGRPARACAPQLLDSMDLERERGITIKAQAVRVFYEARDGRDLPAAPDRHARATSTSPTRSRARSPRARARCSSSTPRRASRRRRVANTYLAVDAGLELIPCLNKIDLPGAEPERVARGGRRAARRAGRRRSCRISRQDRRGRRRRARGARRSACRRPRGDPDAPPRALIFDSEFDQYRGVIAYIRVVDGTFTQGRGDPRDGRPAPRPTSTTSASSRPRMTPVGSSAPARSAT